MDAKQMIKKEFMDRYYQWLEDYKSLPDDDYGWKYGWQKNHNKPIMKDNQQSVVIFQKYIFSGRWMPDWVKAGYNSSDLWKLRDDGFLSAQYYWGSGRRNGDWVYISQRVAKEIYKEFKGAV